MNLDFCHKTCTVGKKVSKEILDESESVKDAAIDFWYFIDECLKTCPYKEEHDKFTAEENQ